MSTRLTHQFRKALGLGPSDHVFKGKGFYVVHRRVCVGVVLPRLHSQAKFVLIFETVSGLHRRRRASGDWLHQEISGRHILCIPSGVEHEDRWDREGESIELYLEPSFLRRFPAETLTALFARENLPEAKTDAVIWELSGAICFLCAEPEIDASLVVGASALVVRRLFVSHATPRAPIRGTKLSDDQRQRMDKYVQTNMAVHFRVPDLARAVGLSSQQFTPLCRNTTGNTPMDYVWECRLLKARELARGGKHTREEIWRQCGFSDLSHLNRRFKSFFRYPLSVLLKSANGSKNL
ncbi:MAG: AraC family transcriptional regulator [Opitutaceae bacterium]|nr:AraC family transcriptional regulator [Opitutaceae bacterium]